MHDFIMRKRQNEILMMMVEHREGEIVLVIFTIDRIAAEVLQRVVHPTHVPLKRESQPAQVGRPSHQRPCGGLFGNGRDPRVLNVHNVIEVF